MPRRTAPPPHTPDGRYIVVRGRLWRASNPALAPLERARLTQVLMDARRRVGVALGAQDHAALAIARRDVHEAKVALGERGPAWWMDGAPDWNRRRVVDTPYAGWYATLASRQPDD